MQGNTQNVPDTLRFFFFYSVWHLCSRSIFQLLQFHPKITPEAISKSQKSKIFLHEGGGGGGGGGIPPVLAVVDHRGCPQWRIQVGFIGFHGTPLL